MPIARINAATKGVSGEPPAADRARAVLLAWRRVWKNRLRCFCSIGLPNGLLIDDIAVHVRGGRAWVSLPAELVLDADGRQIIRERRPQYIAIIRSRTRDLADRFSAAVVELVRGADPEALEEGGAK